VNIRCSTTDEVWQAFTAALEEHRGHFALVLDDSKPAAIIASERYEEMWQAILARCEELQRQPGCQPAMRSTGTVSGDGRHMAAICKVSHDDGTDSVYHVEAHVVTYQPAIKVSVDGPWTDSKDAFWSEQLADRTGAVVIGHTHYRILPDVPASGRDHAGHGGRLFRIRHLGSGEVTETRNLWYQGVIPPKWREQMPDDAEFVTAAEASA
jgi:hypothetical protein